jgi:hypothetical protein
MASSSIVPSAGSDSRTVVGSDRVEVTSIVTVVVAPSVWIVFSTATPLRSTVRTRPFGSASLSWFIPGRRRGGS